MPGWLISLIVSLAIKLGIPYLLKLFPWLPPKVVEIINELLEALSDPTKSNSAAKKMAIDKIKACEGNFCPQDVVKE